MTIIEQAIHLRRATSADRDEAARVLSSAFFDDPVFGWLIPDRDHRDEVLIPFFKAYLAAFAPHDETHLALVDGVVVGVALWAAPGVPVLDPVDATALAEQLHHLVGERMAVLDERFEAVHPTEPVWYLPLLGVDAGLHGRGMGSSLMRQVLDRADADSRDAYLEATTLRSRALYERLGFVCVGEIVLPDGPPVYAMRREPASSGAASSRRRGWGRRRRHVFRRVDPAQLPHRSLPDLEMHHHITKWVR